MKFSSKIEVLFEQKYHLPLADTILAVGHYQQPSLDGLQSRSIAICHWKAEGFENDLMVASCRIERVGHPASVAYTRPLFNAINISALSSKFGFHQEDMKQFIFNLMSSNDCSKVEL